MRIPIVNEQDEVIEYKKREEATHEDIRRIIALYVFNEKGKTLIAKRHSTKIIDPNKWGPAVAGTVDEGYDYDSTVLKEAEEEIGLKDIKPIKEKITGLLITNKSFDKEKAREVLISLEHPDHDFFAIRALLQIHGDGQLSMDPQLMKDLNITLPQKVTAIPFN